jgi:hypothetical protein
MPPSLFVSFKITILLIILCDLAQFFDLRLSSIILLSSLFEVEEGYFYLKVVLIFLIFLLFLTPVNIFYNSSPKKLFFSLVLHNCKDLVFDGRIRIVFFGWEGVYSSSNINRSWSDTFMCSYLKSFNFIFEKVQSILLFLLLGLVPEMFYISGNGITF